MTPGSNLTFSKLLWDSENKFVPNVTSNLQLLLLHVSSSSQLSVCSLKEVSPQITQHGITQSVNAAATTG